jgi:hypothetical protein
MKKRNEASQKGVFQRKARDKTKHSTRVRARPAKDATGAGAVTEAKMLLVLSDPKLMNATTTEKIKRSGVSRATWYRHRNDPLFRARMGHAVREALDEHLGPILHSLAESAKAIGREGHPDRKLYLELIGEYDPAAAKERAKETPLSDPQRMTDEELLNAFAGRMELLPPGVLRRMGKDPDAHLDREGQRETSPDERKRTPSL